MKHICPLLNAVAPCSVTSLKDAGLEYIAFNLEGILENHLLDDLDGDVLDELEEVVQRLQLDASPKVRSDHFIDDLYDRYPDLADEVEVDLRRRISHMQFMARTAEESSTPRPARNIPKSPFIAAIDTSKGTPTDLMFDMDGLDDTAATPKRTDRRPSFAPGTPSAPQSGISREISGADSPPNVTASPSGIAFSPSSPEESFKSRPSTQLPVLVLKTKQQTPSSPSSSSQPWRTEPLQSSKLDMKSIMNQTSAAQKSNIALGIQQERQSIKANAGFAGKISQKERKRQQLEQQQMQEKLRQQAEDEAKAQQTTPMSPQPAKSDLRLSAKSQGKSPWKVEAAPAAKIEEILSPSSVTGSIGQASSPRSARQKTESTPVRSSARSPSTASPTAMFSSHGQTQKLSILSIMSQEQELQDEIKAAAAKRSLLEIQQEQEFAEWWDQESKRVCDAEKEKQASEATDKGAKSTRGSSSGARGGRGRGRGRGGRRGRGASSAAGVSGPDHSATVTSAAGASNGQRATAGRSPSGPMARKGNAPKAAKAAKV
jgi:hypothetical protein